MFESTGLCGTEYLRKRRSRQLTFLYKNCLYWIAPQLIEAIRLSVGVVSRRTPKQYRRNEEVEKKTSPSRVVASPTTCLDPIPSSAHDPLSKGTTERDERG